MISSTPYMNMNSLNATTTGQPQMHNVLSLEQMNRGSAEINQNLVANHNFVKASRSNLLYN